MKGLTQIKQSFITRVKSFKFWGFFIVFDHLSLTILVLNVRDAVSCILFLYFSLDRWLENETAVFVPTAWRHCFLDSKNSYDGQVQILGTVLQTLAAINEFGFAYRP